MRRVTLLLAISTAAVVPALLARAEGPGLRVEPHARYPIGELMGRATTAYRAATRMGRGAWRRGPRSARGETVVAEAIDGVTAHVQAVAPAVGDPRATAEFLVRYYVQGSTHAGTEAHRASALGFQRALGRRGGDGRNLLSTEPYRPSAELYRWLDEALRFKSRVGVIAPGLVGD